MKQHQNTASFGFSEADITPERPAELVGFPRTDNSSRGILHPLKSQILIIQAPGETVCLTTVDSLGFTVELTLSLRKQLAKVLKIPTEKIMICFSHTHSAPNAAAEPAYFSFVCSQICAAAKQAAINMNPFFAAWGIGDHLIGINRRSETSPEESRLGILKLSDPDGVPSFLLLRVSAHANVLTSDNYKISSDYFSLTRQKLSEAFGCPVMMVQGASGNLRPRFQQENAAFMEIQGVDALEKPYTDFEKQLYFQQSMDALENMAASVFHSAAPVIAGLKTEPVRRLSMFSVTHQFDADVPSLEYADQIANEAKAKAGIDGSGWLTEIRKLHRRQIQVQTADVEFQYFILNSGCFCGVPNEIMCEIALDVWHQSAESLFFLNGYTNGIDSYLPTAEEYDKGGYEVLWSNLIYYPYYGRVMALNRESAGQMASFAVTDFLHRLKS
ncbi:hypothetical protein [Anaerostipes sp.]|uniref:hypothetical protein n=1 Tax=Anaerostipes sp. TaxID=1872530 RepID=UPI0025B880FC|nr:hypothetical protein [Anaerostipes sp.]MBS7007373.1 hypothetical protein [Anaerostipes sp.]